MDPPPRGVMRIKSVNLCKRLITNKKKKAYNTAWSVHIKYHKQCKNIQWNFTSVKSMIC